MADNTVQFVKTVWEYYAMHGRDLPWRVAEADGSFDPYKVLVSELMLQQTQVGRVVPKYHKFLHTFPDIEALADASLANVLRVWSGLGYNRRAKYLHEAARILAPVKRPWSVEQLTKCKGIGHNTAAAICVYSFNQPLVFVETNIRTVYIHHFFTGKHTIDDKAIAAKLAATLDTERPREFYWALMDYGSSLKQGGIKNLHQTKHYKKQSSFVGSRRQVRGEVLKFVTRNNSMEIKQLRRVIADERLDEVVGELAQEGLIKIDGTHVKV